MSSTISFSFNPSSIPAEHQPAFMARFFQLVTEYQIMSSGFVAPQYHAPHPDAPAADTLPMPTSFVAVDGDDTSVPASVNGDSAVAKKPRKNPWADLTAEQKAERLAAMKRGREAKNAERKMSGDSLDATATSDYAAPAPVPTDAVTMPLEDMTAFQLFCVYSQLKELPAPTKDSFAGLPAAFHGKANLLAEVRRLQSEPLAVTTSANTDNVSVSSSTKKERKPRAPLTDEQRTVRRMKLQATLAAKKATATTSSA